MTLCRRMGTVILVLHEVREMGKGLIIGDFSVFYNDPDFFARAMGNEGLSACGFVTGCQTMILNSKGK